MVKEVLIMGAGKIGRGFIGQLFYRSGYRLWFVDTSEELVERLNIEKKYRVDLARLPSDDTEYIRLEGAFTPQDKRSVGEVLDRVEIMAMSVGAGNLETTAAFVRELIKQRDISRRLNWLICENALDPARKVMDILLEGADAGMKSFLQGKLGLIETQVLRTGMPAKTEILEKEPLALRMQNWWTLPLDKDAFVGEIPDIRGFLPRTNFRNELIRKLYTFNGTNGPIAYIGWVNGFRILHESALAFRPFFEEIQEESAWGLVNEYGFKPEEHREYMVMAMNKYTDPAINDLIERNGRELRRKLGQEERMLGPALLCLKHGRKPMAYSKAIAAAYCFDGSDDEGTLAVRETVTNRGIEEAIKTFSGIDESNQLFSMIVEAFRQKTYLFGPDIP
jgi:mannitol-1-phosphate 5-dehydrogenase